ncbi:uncharacterized protein LOC119647842 [Hermetia illucens]|uniref:uncharacterized protein LOC119647842 n=1 Tax=Hermetia illucens TaxID=343691 RepID=UPI0018CBF541|nr:uncharacterized protein LOC119647842 [Hermetia illucens]XP_037905025.1 uncharacterized protein LOC119647842 [Hermetia illucens]XP_037905026.1 uncharacterized protein LOC119647842 [Hermetia illucens]
MASEACRCLEDLNADCLFKIFSYLSLPDQFRFSLETDNFNHIIQRILKSNFVDTREFRTNFNLNQSALLLSKFGPSMERLDFTEWINESNASFYKLLPLYCTSVSQVNFFYPSSKGIEIYLDVLSKNSSRINSVHVGPFNPECDHTDLQRYEVDLFEAIVKLENLKTLHLEKLNEVTGENFHLLRNLKELNVEFCANYESEFFTELCESPIRLSKLNINNCTCFTADVLEKLVESQPEIKELTINNIPEGFEKVVKLKKLEKLTIWESLVGRPIDKLIDNLIKYHEKDLKSLQILCDYPRNIADYRPKILFLKNLKELRLPNYVSYDDTYLLRITQSLPNLQKLYLYIDDKKCLITDNGIFTVFTQLPHLREIGFYYRYKFNSELLERICSTRKAGKCGQLMVYMKNDKVLQDILQDPFYLQNSKYVKFAEYQRKHLLLIF